MTLRPITPRSPAPRWITACVLGAGLFSLACVSETTGNKGNLSFYYTADDSVANFNKPIAVGAKLELFVRDAGDGSDRAVTLLTATTDDESVARVESFSDNSMVLEGLSAGEFEVSVSASVERTNEQEDDSVDMLVRVPEVLRLSHTCRGANDRRGYYLKGSNVYIPFEMKLKDGQDVIGYGYYPVEAEPAEAITFVEGQKGQQYINYKVGEELGEITLSSTIDSTSIVLDVVEEAQINGARLAEDKGDLRNGQTNVRFVLPTIDDEAVCQATLQIAATSLTPQVCEVSPSAEARDIKLDQYTGSGWLEITGKSEGECTFEVTFPKAAIGEGVTESFTLTVKD